MSSDENNGSSELNPKVEKEFDWKEIDPESLLTNEKYRELYKRQRERQDILNNNETLQGDDFWNELRRIDRENDSDERGSLTPFELHEFQYFRKYERLEEIADEVDPLMYGVSKEFDRLPFTIRQSCSGHIDEGTREFTDDTYGLFVFTTSEYLTDEEKEVQNNFIQGLADLDVQICNNLGISPYNILDITAEIDDGEEDLTIFDLLEKGRELTLKLNLDPDLPIPAVQALTTVWEAIYGYINEFTGRSPEPLDFKGGDIFVKAKK